VGISVVGQLRSATIWLVEGAGESGANSSAVWASSVIGGKEDRVKGGAMIIRRTGAETKTERLSESLGLRRKVLGANGDLGRRGAPGDSVYMGLMRNVRGVGEDLEAGNVLKGHRLGRRKGKGFRNRDRGADLIWTFCESLFQKRADVGGGAGFLEP
jgi:hypothetical protein